MQSLVDGKTMNQGLERSTDGALTFRVKNADAATDVVGVGMAVAWKSHRPCPCVGGSDAYERARKRKKCKEKKRKERRDRQTNRCLLLISFVRSLLPLTFLQSGEMRQRLIFGPF
jgi:hypothetical protein